MLVVVNKILVIVFMFSAHKLKMTNNLRPIQQIIIIHCHIKNPMQGLD